ncbi:DNA-binding transcriptional regulator ume6 [Oleoguttula sp. CCFEE 5521]
MAAPTVKKCNATSAEGKAAAAAAAKMHRRSRSGCFTCRLRRKKCEEGKPSCKACRHLGLRCDYKRPMWWSNGEQRRQQKEVIKNVIKQTQVSKKVPTPHQHGTSTPPSLCHSVPSAPTSADIYSDSMPHTRAPSVDSPFSDFTHITPDGYFQIPPPPQHLMSHSQYPMFSPYEVDIKTERSVFVNDVQTRRDSTISTFSTFQPPPQANGMPAFPADSWIQQEYHENLHETFPEEPVDFDFFEFPHGQMTPTHETIVEVEECDKYLLSHFLDKVIKLIFPILDANQHGSTRSDVVLPALESNKPYLHCCLSVAATHMKATEGLVGEQIDNDIVRHRYSAISELCEALGQDVNHSQILEATLGMIFFQCSVGRPDDALPDIPWHQHFQAATSLIHKLELPKTAVELSASGVFHPSFNMTLASWIDILGATIMGRAPTFADTYRELNLNRGSAGLGELMGCDDQIMFLISEIACLDLQKSEGLDDVMLCKYVEILAAEIGQTEGMGGAVSSCISTTGALRPKQLRTNVTAIFRVAARIYLCTLVPGYEPNSPSMRHLVAQFCDFMSFIPEGGEGFDRSLAWPLLIAGASATADTPYRAMFSDRCAKLGDAADFGSFGRIRELLHDTWSMHDAAAANGDATRVHWRDIMRQKQWDFLLI